VRAFDMTASEIRKTTNAQSHYKIDSDFFLFQDLSLRRCLRGTFSSQNIFICKEFLSRPSKFSLTRFLSLEVAERFQRN
jgi:hypothetical protein